ncbi:MAG TPA: PKD domain-containing protein, partial [Bacteroidetes bacterium]|nr:PKD domain-containing protein [Bacteroidota bacterium]
MKKIVLIALLWGLYAPIYAQCSAIIDLNTWVQEGPPASGNWAVNLMGTQLTQSINGWPTFFVSPQDFINVRITGTIRVNTTGDDDFVGFVFGWQPMGNTGPNYTVNGMLFDWKQGNQTWNSNLGLQGKILSNIDGYTSTLNTAGATASTFWGHVNQPPQFNVIAQNTGNGTGWQDNTTYAFSLTYLSNRTVIKIDADTIFDISGCFSPGRFGFYNYSQSQVIYSNFAYELIPDFTMATANVCLTDSAHFQFVVDSCANLNQNNFPISNWLWDFGDGSSSNLVNPTHLYASPGIYPVKLVTRDSIGCTDSVTKFITIDSVPPPPVLASNSPLCDGDSLSLTGMLVPNTTVSWTGPNGFSSSLQNPVINPVSPASAGTYACTLFYGVCPGLPDSLAVIVHPLPPGLAPTSNSPICTDSTLLLTAAPVTGGSYSWTGPNGFASNLQNPSLNNVTTAQAGNYVVFATANGCIGPVDSTTVTVNPTPIASIAGDTTLCIGDVTMLLASGGNTYLWSNSQTSATISLSPLVNTTYSVVATDADGCPSLPRSVTLLVSPLPTPMLGPDTSACDSFLLDAGPGYLNYLWSTGATTQTVAISATGLVWVEVMSTDSCLGRDSVNITINVPSPVSLGPDLAKCAWDSITLNTNPSGFSNYVWNTAATTSTITVGGPGIYAVTVTNGNGCLS